MPDKWNWKGKNPAWEGKYWRPEGGGATQSSDPMRGMGPIVNFFKEAFMTPGRMVDRAFRGPTSQNDPRALGPMIEGGPQGEATMAGLIEEYGKVNQPEAGGYAVARDNAPVPPVQPTQPAMGKVQGYAQQQSMAPQGAPMNIPQFQTEEEALNWLNSQPPQKAKQIMDSDEWWQMFDSFKQSSPPMGPEARGSVLLE